MLSLPASGPRRRPFDLGFWADERPPAGPLALLGVQHAATSMAFVVYVLAAAQIAGLPAHQIQSIVAFTLIGVALCCALQAWGGRLGYGDLLVNIPNPFMVSVVAGAMLAQGAGAIVAVSVLTGIVALCVAPLMSRLRTAFPPAVAGTVICLGGLALAEPAIRHSFGFGEARQVDPDNALVSLSALAVIVALSIWGGRKLRLLALLAGIAVGLAIAALLGNLTGFEQTRALPWFAMPTPVEPVFSLQAGTIAAVVLIAILTQLDQFGCMVVVDKMNDADWRRADMRRVGRAIRANGACDALTGLFGAYPTGISSANIALAHATRATSRHIGLVAAGLLAALAFMPKATLALSMLPPPVLGAVELYASAYLIVSGMELIASRAFDSRGVFMVGLSLAIGVAVMLMPDIGRDLPGILPSLANSGFVVGGLLVVGMNLLFRLGARRSTSLALDAPDIPIGRQVTDFVERQGAAWGARRDVVQRAALASLEACDALAAAGRPPLRIHGSFDEFNLDIRISHEGAPLPLPAADRPPGALPPPSLDDSDDAIEAAMQQISGALLRHLADRTEALAAADGTGQLRLHYEH
jgi:xanthine/uracil permease